LLLNFKPNSTGAASGFASTPGEVLSDQSETSATRGADWLTILASAEDAGPADKLKRKAQVNIAASVLMIAVR
jgi:3-keto-L-gulonate-6-phosphate decarboxylase